MTKREIAELRKTQAMLQSILRTIQAAEDIFYKQAKEKGWLDNEEYKHALWSHQHRVSSSLHNAQALARKIAPPTQSIEGTKT